MAGKTGVCEPQGFCSFPDPTCPGGQRFEPNAGDGLANTCVAVDAGVDAPIDAAVKPSCITDVALGRHFTCVLLADHTVRCVGDNATGQLGAGIAGPAQLTWTEVKDGTTMTAIVDATAIGNGGDHACMLRAGGAVWCWGSNTNGEVGNNTVVNANAAVPVQTTSGQPLTGMTAVVAGVASSCALDGNGNVWCWGRNSEGELGDGTTTERHQAAEVLVAPAGAVFTGAVELSAGKFHVCARKANSEVWCWGQNQAGELGDGTTANRPSPVKPLVAAHVVAGAYANSCALLADGTVKCWGASWRGRLGTGGDNNSPNALAPTAVLAAPNAGALTGVTELVMGGSSCALLADSSVHCWGDNIHGQNGDGAGSLTPSSVLEPNGKPLTGVDRLVAHFPHICAHRTNGQWSCWGRDLDGELGDGMQTQHSFPVPLEYPCP